MFPKPVAMSFIKSSWSFARDRKLFVVFSSFITLFNGKLGISSRNWWDFHWGLFRRRRFTLFGVDGWDKNRKHMRTLLVITWIIPTICHPQNRGRNFLIELKPRDFNARDFENKNNILNGIFYFKKKEKKSHTFGL